MPKILIAVSLTDKKVKRAATSLQNMKALCKVRAEKFQDLTYRIFTFTDPMKLSHVVMLINSPTKTLAKHATTVETLTIDLEKGRCRVKAFQAKDQTGAGGED